MIKVKNQRLEKRSRVIARARDAKSGHGRHDMEPRFKVGNVVDVHTTDGGFANGTVVAVDSSGRLQIRYRPCPRSGLYAMETVDPHDDAIRVVLCDEDSDYRYTYPAREQEQHLREVALAKQAHWERQHQADEMALASVLLSKRALLASGELCATTSSQGVSPVEVPTRAERAALVRVLYMYTDRADLAIPTGIAHDYVQTPWPAHEDQLLMKMASERLDQGDFCAALVLIKWATATVDTTKRSLTYQKPKLASRIFKLQLKVNQWMVKHAAYLPLHKSMAVLNHHCDSVEEYLCRRSLDNAARRLALAMCLLARSRTPSPADSLDFDTLRRTVRVFSKLQADYGRRTWYDIKRIMDDCDCSFAEAESIVEMSRTDG
eukprot:COSAG02_NODE_381_length_23450_cov_65.782493_19_plen_377_part_00